MLHVFSRTRARWLSLALVLSAFSLPSDDFPFGFASSALGASAAPPSEKLPADGIYPHGRKLAFMGYSGDPARDLANGFTVAGPVYGDQKPYLSRR